MAKPDKYVGVDKDLNGGMTTIGKMIRDAQVFGLIPENETCEGWNRSGIDVLLHKVNDEWDKYGCMVSLLPPELAEKHSRIHSEAMKKARESGWSGEVETGDDN